MIISQPVYWSDSKGSNSFAKETPSTIDPDAIVIFGARQHNLKRLNISIPRNKLVVITGVSGSGKSSLAFNTIHAEGQRRYVESLSPFMRHFLEKVERPEIDTIQGLTPTIAIEQKTIGQNPRSTVGTATEIFHYLRLLYARIGSAYCLHCDYPLRPLSSRMMTEYLASSVNGTTFRLFAPLKSPLKGDLPLLVDNVIQQGYTQARVNGTMTDTLSLLAIEPDASVEIFIGNFTVTEELKRENLRFVEELHISVKAALQLSGGLLKVVWQHSEEMILSDRKVCPQCAHEFPEITPQHFNYNTPLGMCQSCQGLGTTLVVDAERLVAHPDISILDGALSWFGNLRKNKRSTWPIGPIDVIADHYGADLEKPWQDLPQRFRDALLYGSGTEKIRYPSINRKEDSSHSVKGLIPEIDRLFHETKADASRERYALFMVQRPCTNCHGTRLGNIARSVSLNGKTIATIGNLTIDQVLPWLYELDQKLNDEQLVIALDALRELKSRLSFMHNVGLHYLTLNRPVTTLSGGEGQRVRIVCQLGSGLSGVTYILDEPSIGLHARDRSILLEMLFNLRNLGNTVIVVEHDELTMRHADWLIDLGPGAGVLGGEIMAIGTPEQVMENPASLTGRYLSGTLQISNPTKRSRLQPSQDGITIVNATLHNLKNVTVTIPLGMLTCVTGVSGSGKSSLIGKTLAPALSCILDNAEELPGPYDRIEGAECIERMITITQAPIGRTSRSNPATYVGIFDEIRQIFSATPEAKKRKYKPSHFSFNVVGGRCEACEGHGRQKVEMHFLPDVWVTCQECYGLRYNQDVLSIRYKGKNIIEVLQMDIRESLEFFADRPNILRILGMLNDVGLDYMKLGQSATTLSGGEAQRIKLAKELSMETTGHTLYILDEPTTGLHFADIQRLIDVLRRLIDKGHTVLIIEHDMDVIKSADWIIDMGPEGGVDGGSVIAQGTPEQITQVEQSYTGRSLAQKFAVMIKQS